MYELLSQFAQTWGLLIFVFAFVLVLLYALAPSNKKTFERARRMPLQDDELNDGGNDRG